VVKVTDPPDSGTCNLFKDTALFHLCSSRFPNCARHAPLTANYKKFKVLTQQWVGKRAKSGA